MREKPSSVAAYEDGAALVERGNIPAAAAGVGADENTIHRGRLDADNRCGKEGRAEKEAFPRGFLAKKHPKMQNKTRVEE
jgi:hypothetical protein